MKTWWKPEEGKVNEKSVICVSHNQVTSSCKSGAHVLYWATLRYILSCNCNSIISLLWLSKSMFVFDCFVFFCAFARNRGDYDAGKVWIFLHCLRNTLLHFTLVVTLDVYISPAMTAFASSVDGTFLFLDFDFSLFGLGKENTQLWYNLYFENKKYWDLYIYFHIYILESQHFTFSICSASPSIFDIVVKT